MVKLCTYMITKSHVSYMQNYYNISQLADQPTREKHKQLLSRIFRLLFLFAMMIFLGGYDNSNPKIGKSNLDFYFNDSRELLSREIDFRTISSDDAQKDSLKYWLAKLTADFYANRNYSPAWTFNFAVNEDFHSLANLLDSIEYFGVPKSLVKYSELSKLIADFELQADEKSLQNRAALELKITETVFLTLITLHSGITISDTSAQFAAFAQALPSRLEYALQNGSMRELWMHVQPVNPTYQKMIDGFPEFLSFYYSLKAAPDSILTNDLILTQALRYTGSMHSLEFDSINTREYYLKKFQKSGKIEATGSLNAETVANIKQVLEQRYFQLFVNADRLRKLNLSTDNYLLVNIPEYRLYFVENSGEADTFKVIVGATQTPTPVVSSQIEQIIANPFWTVPTSIAKNEMLHKIRSDSSYLERNQYFIVDRNARPVDVSKIDWTHSNPLGGDYYIRQKNGSSNALGMVKFLFPNPYDVYLHDTPGKNLFNKDRRAFSHGCIRVQNPEILAQHLVEHYGPEQAVKVEIEQLIADKKITAIKLERTIPIHIQYITCGISDNGSFIFFDDIYNIEHAAIDELKGLIDAI